MVMLTGAIVLVGLLTLMFYVDLTTSAVLVNFSRATCSQTVKSVDRTIIQCNVNSGEFVDFDDVRNVVSGTNDVIKYEVYFTCDGGKIRLPWPFTAPNVVHVSAEGCVVEEYLSEILTSGSQQNSLQYVSLVNVTIYVSIRELYDVTINLKKLTNTVGCGPSNANIHIFRNVNYDISMETVSLEEEVLLHELLMSGGLKQQLVTKNDNCVYPNLVYLEESGSRSLSSIHFKLFETSLYPSLRTYSIRNNTLQEIPSELRNLDLKFLPSLTRLDLSQNRISRLDFTTSMKRRQNKLLYVDLRGNDVRDIDSALFKKLLKSKYALIDLRDNPLVCTCNLDLYVRYLLQASVQDARAMNIYKRATCKTREQGKIVTKSLPEVEFSACTRSLKRGFQ